MTLIKKVISNIFIVLITLIKKIIANISIVLITSQALAKRFTYTNVHNDNATNLERDILLLSPILQRWELRLREVQSLTRNSTT